MDDFVTESGGKPFVGLAVEEVLGGHNISLMGLCDDERVEEDPRQDRCGAVRWLSVAEGVVEHPKVDVLFLDLTGDGKDRSRKLAALASSKQRTSRSSLEQPFDIWRGDWYAVFTRLVTFFEQSERWFPEFDMGETYAVLQKAIVLEICKPPEGPPRCGRELRERSEDEELPTRDGLALFPRELLDTAIGRMSSMARILEEAEANTAISRMDSTTRLVERAGWSWEDASVAYLGLNENESVIRDTLGTMLLLSLTEHLEELYRQGRSCVVFIDVLPEDIGSLEMEALFGAAWAFGSGVVLLPEVTGDLSRFVRLRFPSSGATAECIRLLSESSH